MTQDLDRSRDRRTASGDEVPLYPDRERPLREVRPVTEQD